MSKTDNTQPLQLQWADTTRKGYVSHMHTAPCVGDGTPRECDYSPSAGLANFRRKKVKSHRDSEYFAHWCIRVTYSYGGKNSEEGNYKQKRKGIKRSLRTRERQALRRTQSYGLRKDGTPKIDFDLLPKWGDHGVVKPFAKSN